MMMRATQLSADAVADFAPQQYAVGEKCEGVNCGTILSRYNQFALCGRCRSDAIVKSRKLTRVPEFRTRPPVRAD